MFSKRFDKIILLLLCVYSSVIIFTSCENNAKEENNHNSTPQLTSPSEIEKEYSVFSLRDGQRSFKGMMDKSYPIQMDMEIKSSSVTATYSYESSHGKSYSLNGHIQPEGVVFLTEKDADGNPSGGFTGVFTSAYTIEGTWSNINSGSPLPFILTDVKAPLKASDIFHQTKDTIEGVLIHQHAIFCSSCDCYIRMKYPQIRGLSTQTPQEKINHGLRMWFLNNIDSRCELMTGKDTDLSFITGVHHSPWISFAKTEVGEKIIDGITFSLENGEQVSLMDIVKDPIGLKNYLATSDGSTDVGLNTITFFLRRNEIMLYFPDGHSVTISLTSSKLRAFFSL